ncbi:Beta-lactamase-like protein [Penicillium cataractarum]|uniref:Beta-lactamase-like protein n=1 Tax=Penicillium cataractarum TaxID=2100454 RepID=A0A9W9SK97_9EURO|nr:Beta-lactamase-like protein [Penicillium cataractarum]KAJ5380131.1 Beta-lactamase-like protein [Penicillium cataractarum]
MYGVASHLIETVTNQSLGSFLQDNIWLPLGMTETYISLEEAESAQQDVSQGFYMTEDGNITSTDRVFIETLRGADYVKWVSTLLNRGPPFSQSAYATLLGSHSIVSRNPVEPFQTPTLYGLGWMLQAYHGEVILSHEGSQFGYGASVVLLPQRKFGLVLLGNNMNGVNAAANVLAYHLIDEELDIPPERRFDWVKRYAK